MTMVDECPHMGGDPAWCSICRNGPTRPAPRRWTAVSHPVPARFEGQCPSCNLPVRIGQLIVHTTSGLYVHDECQDR